MLKDAVKNRFETFEPHIGTGVPHRWELSLYAKKEKHQGRALKLTNYKKHEQKWCSV